MWAHLAEPGRLINMPGVHFMMTAVISRNDFSDGWRPVSARGIRSHVKRAPLSSLREPEGVHGNRAARLFLPPRWETRSRRAARPRHVNRSRVTMWCSDGVTRHRLGRAPKSTSVTPRGRARRTGIIEWDSRTSRRWTAVTKGSISHIAAVAWQLLIAMPMCAITAWLDSFFFFWTAVLFSPLLFWWNKRTHEYFTVVISGLLCSSGS